MKLIKFNSLSLVILSIFAFQEAMALPLYPIPHNPKSSSYDEPPPSYDEIFGRARSELEEIQCPDGYILVPGNPLYSTPISGKDFCVMKYEASRSSLFSRRMKAVSVKKAPWVNVNRAEAEAACEANGVGYHLITNSEWMTIARNIEATPANWSGGRIGEGFLPRGNSSFDSALTPGNDENPYFGILYHNDDWTYKRTHELSNGEVIWDMAGNVLEWVSDNLGTGQHKMQEYSNETHFSREGEARNRVLFAPNGNYNSTQNVGMIYMSNNGAALRGGYWANGMGTGVFAADLNYSASASLSHIGFRCAYTPQ